MSKDLRRKQKKAKRAQREAKRRLRTALKAAGWSGASKRLTRSEIEAEIKLQLAQLTRETPGSEAFDEQIQTVLRSSPMYRLNWLQSELFRVVFRRDHTLRDPVFWDREREREGVFPLDPDKATNEYAYLCAMADRHPEIKYAIELTAAYPLRQRLHLYPKERMAEWQAAVDDYVHQAATGIPPVEPNTLMNVLEAAAEVLELPNVIPSRIAEALKTHPNPISIAMESELGRHETTDIVFARVLALFEIAEAVEFSDALTPMGYSSEAMTAAASAEIDRRTGRFVLESFRKRLDDAMAEERHWNRTDDHDQQEARAT